MCGEHPCATASCSQNASHGRLWCVHVSCVLLTTTTSSVLITLLLQELARLLAEPLRPGFSQKYFTGGAAGAAAMLLSSGGAAAGPDAKPGDPKAQVSSPATATGAAAGQRRDMRVLLVCY